MVQLIFRVHRQHLLFTIVSLAVILVLGVSRRLLLTQKIRLVQNVGLPCDSYFCLLRGTLCFLTGLTRLELLQLVLLFFLLHLHYNQLLQLIRDFEVQTKNILFLLICNLRCLVPGKLLLAFESMRSKLDVLLF